MYCGATGYVCHPIGGESMYVGNLRKQLQAMVIVKCSIGTSEDAPSKRLAKCGN